MIAAAGLICLLGVSAAAEPIRDGAFGFPQADAVVLCDRADLRVSVWNNAMVLYVQAVVWADDDDATGETPDGRPIGDNAYLSLDVNADGTDTAEVDRVYSLNPWPSRPGLRYQVARGGGVLTHFRHDSAGRGAIAYLRAADGRRVRVDSFAIPLAELKTRPGRNLRLVYWAQSPASNLTLDSARTPRSGVYYIKSIPMSRYHSITLAGHDEPLDLSAVPAGREAAPSPAPAAPTLAIGSTPPEFAAADWLNVDARPTLRSLRGRVVLVDFWSSNCGSCVKTLGELNRLHDSYAARGLQVVGLTTQNRRSIELFMTRTPIRYAIGTGTSTRSAWNVPSVSYAYLIGRDGRLLWRGVPDSRLAGRVSAALAPGPAPGPAPAQVPDR